MVVAVLMGGAGDRRFVPETKADGDGEVFAQGFVTPPGRTLLLVNRRNRTVGVTLPEGGANVAVVRRGYRGGPTPRVACVSEDRSAGSLCRDDGVLALGRAIVASPAAGTGRSHDPARQCVLNQERHGAAVMEPEEDLSAP